MVRDLTGQRFGKLVAIAVIVEGRRAYWKCICDCGKEVVPRSDALTLGKMISCGCSDPRKKHGMWKSPEFMTWSCMKRRCSGKDPKDKEHYTDKGITVCDEWANDFAKFYADMGPRPTPQHTIDRLDGTKGYYKENCRWATKEEQSRNLSSNVLLSFQGKTMCIVEWAEYLNVPSYLIAKRIRKGWPIEKALTLPTIPNGKRTKEYVSSLLSQTNFPICADPVGDFTS